MMNGFTFNGTSTQSLGLLVTALNPYNSATRKVDKFTIPYRNGDLIIDSGTYDNIRVGYEISVIRNTKATCDAINEWLSGSQGYCILSDTYNPEIFRVGYMADSIEYVLTALYREGKATIEFDCLPQKYLVSNRAITFSPTSVTTENTAMSLSTVPVPLDITLKGNTTQEGSSGKNLIPRPYYQTDGTYQGVTWTTDNMGKITGSGTTTAGTNFYLTASSSYSLPAGTYTISVTGTQTGMDLRIYNGSAILATVPKGSVNGHATFTTTATNNLSIYFNVADAGASVNISAYVQLEKGSTATAYEPHISPTNPQDIKSVKGDNEVVICGKNLLTPFVLGISINSNNGNEVPSVLGATTDYIPVDYDVNPNYYLSGISNTIHSFVCAYNSKKQFLGRTGSTFRADITLPKTVYTSGTAQGTGDIAYLRVTYYQQGTDTDVNTANNYLTQLEVGNARTTYEPYTRQSYPIYLPVENYCNWESTWAGYLQTDGTLKNPSPSLNWYFPQSLVGKQVTISAKAKAGVSTANLRIRTSINGTATNANMITNTDNFEITKITVTPTSTSDYFALYSSTNNGYFKDIQVEVGTNASQYNPYGNPSIELNKIGTYQDYIYKNGDKWYVHKETASVDLGTLTSWAKTTSSSIDVGYYFNCQPLNFRVGRELWYCSHYLNTRYVGLSNIVRNYGSGINKIGFTASSSQFYIIDSSYTDVTAFKTAMNGVILCYELATPTNTEITDTTLINQLNNIEKAYSYDGNTNISQVSSENGFMLSVTSLSGASFVSNYRGEPVITVNRTGLISFNGIAINVTQAPMTINSQTMQCYNGTVNLNNYAEMDDFPMIKKGDNTIGSSMTISVVPNYWKL